MLNSRDESFHLVITTTLPIFTRQASIVDNQQSSRTLDFIPTIWQLFIHS